MRSGRTFQNLSARENLIELAIGRHIRLSHKKISLSTARTYMIQRNVHRRTFLKTAGAVPLAAGAAPPATPTDAPANLPVLGEPYELAGKRLPFLNWFYIQTGGFSWIDPNGKKVGTGDSLPPGVAQFRHNDQPYGIHIRALPARRMGPLLKAERPWEEGSVTITTIIKDGGMYRGWAGPFTTSGDPPGQKHYMYFESADGMNWKRPDAGVVEYNGSRANNIVNIFETDGGSIFVDPSAPAAERYKLIAEGPFSRQAVEAYVRKRPGVWDPRSARTKDGGVHAVKGAVSADGIHWTMFPEPLVIEVTDTQLTAYYDTRLRKYVAFTRTWPAHERSAHFKSEKRSWTSMRRSIGRSETSDFHSLPLAETILEPGLDLLPSDVLYTNAKTTYPGAPDQHILFPSIWHMSRDNTSITMATSHDGRMWHFMPGAPVLSTGPFGDFDGGCIFAHPNLTELPNGDFILPYTGYNVPHKYPRKSWKYSLGYAVWPKGRIVALEAAEHGEFATVTFIPPGRKLRVNAVTPRAGSILVEVAGADRKPLAGRSFAEATPIVGDHTATVLSWNGNEDLGHPENSPIFLRFRMDQAQIFSLEFV